MRGSAYANGKRVASELALLNQVYDAVEAEREGQSGPSGSSHTRGPSIIASTTAIHAVERKGEEGGLLRPSHSVSAYTTTTVTSSSSSSPSAPNVPRSLTQDGPRATATSNPSLGPGSTLLPELKAAARDMTPRRLKERLGDSLTVELRRFSRWRRLLLLLLESENARLSVWARPILENGREDVAGQVERGMTEDAWRTTLRYAWEVSRPLAFRLVERFPRVRFSGSRSASGARTGIGLRDELLNLIREEPARAVAIPEAVPLMVEQLAEATAFELKHLLYWAPVPPITAISYLLPTDRGPEASSPSSLSPLVLQYAMRSLGHFPIQVVFFYVPQLVQALRYDTLGYVEGFILTTARVSQRFAHQILWNMQANAYKDDDSTIEDELKPSLDHLSSSIVSSLSGEDKAFYEREFSFFTQVTGISGKLKPYIRRSKQEKKAKIDEEMRKIVVDVGVYLPSNPDGVVIGIDHESGKPLQSHAKAPFMATFQVKALDEDEGMEGGKAKDKKSEMNTSGEEEGVGGEEDEDVEKEVAEAVTQKGHEAPETRMMRRASTRVTQESRRLSAIFKVGDDCRQDVLALQLVAMFRGIFASAGLDLYVFPYRVVATAPGCGVIDVIPNSISRDMLGRERINSMYEYFKRHYGPPEFPGYQKARNNFIQSMAAYSVISYLLQFKDRHNGNIMLDDQGHIIHIDFGFILDIAPGGINFESSPFKLTTEMIEVMGGRGGGGEMQPFTWFCELCVKAFLASR